ncbi:MAG: hypothetical protein KGY66_04225 [Candidatus Thermoplasmatota archaeon]|nr:hypothetical protein [Candidatus Thermoplasmatota archaeon]MBS3790104.1 hypothetical protein [Candidatus Thermoplasmatota archaeon]
MFKKIIRLPYSYGAMAFLAIFLGLFIDGYPRYSDEITMISLLIIMSLSIREVKFKKLRSLRRHMGNFLIAFLLNYGLLSITLISLSYLLFEDIQMIQGMVVFAVVPSAIAVIPFTSMLEGDTELSLISSALLYLSSLVIAPAVLLLLFGREIGIWPILRNLIILIVVPTLISRFLLKIDYRDRDHDQVIVNSGFFLIIFGAVGANRHLFFNQTNLLLPILFIAAVRSIGLASLVHFGGKQLKTSSKKLKSYTLFTSLKNGGLSIILAISLFGSKASFPIVLGFVFDPILLVYLKRIIYRNST